MEILFPSKSSSCLPTLVVTHTVTHTKILKLTGLFLTLFMAPYQVSYQVLTDLAPSIPRLSLTLVSISCQDLMSGCMISSHPLNRYIFLKIIH